MVFNKLFLTLPSMIKVYENISLRDRNSFGIDQRARQLIEFDSLEELHTIFESESLEEWMVVGGGNNIIFTKDYEGTLLCPVGQRIEILSEIGGKVQVRVDAGLEWDDLVEWSVQNGLWGLENLSQIPGKVGAAPVQNIGAYGCDVSQTIKSVELFSVDTLSSVVLSGEHCGFGYRESVFKGYLKGRVIITSVSFVLNREPNPQLSYGDLEREVALRGGASLLNIRDAVCAIRGSKLPDPKQMGNAGSFFKNPIVGRGVAEELSKKYDNMPQYPIPSDPEHVKLAAGWLIDRVGLKGYSEGSVGVHDKQALVLVNRGEATGEQVMRFARMVQQRVADEFGVGIDTEVNIV